MIIILYFLGILGLLYYGFLLVDFLEEKVENKKQFKKSLKIPFYLWWHGISKAIKIKYDRISNE